MDTHWYILGAGSIGSLFASCLSRAGSPITLLQRSSSALQGEIPVRIERDGTVSQHYFPTSRNNDSGYISHLLITTKSYDVRSALHEVAHRLDTNSHIVVLVNGMGFIEEILSEFPQHQFAFGITTEGVYRLKPGVFHHAGCGSTQLGQLESTKPARWYASWSGIDLENSWVDNIKEVLWMKLCVNCAINPLTALHGCNNGALSVEPALIISVQNLCDEIAMVSEATGYVNVALGIHERVAEVIENTATNRSSMLQDIEAKRRCEIDDITGYFIARAHQAGVGVPDNTDIFDRVKKMSTTACASKE